MSNNSSAARNMPTSVFPSAISGWNRFWFESSWNPSAIRTTRCGLALVAALWFASFFPSLAAWFGEQGVLHSRFASLLIEFEQLASWQMWSPLWWTDNLLFYQAWLALGVVCSVLVALNIGGRISAVVLWVLAVGWTHRICYLVGALEPALMSMLLYLVLFPGFPAGRDQSQSALGMRLVQSHGWLLMAAGVLSQLASLIWWRGDGVWWLAGIGRSRLFTLESLQDSPQLVNGLTHAVIGIQILALGLLLTASARKLGFLLAVLACLSIAFVWDQGLYALLIGVALLPFVARSEPT